MVFSFLLRLLEGKLWWVYQVHFQKTRQVIESKEAVVSMLVMANERTMHAVVIIQRYRVNVHAV